ncbi:fatty acid--CoA ligase [Geomonas sp. Red69]|uniref:Fatty acid--CoA ligase n=1 Tax=Geomonas diazotrophica TaxID=2843197 RepID=A0ABX8JQ43_9BACT|nr:MULTISPECIES: fatty acid--CoA ligase [Geomonas]MBU5637627.1 fatty acid--CoA ligase [Geomonas diazotrophica]QWV99256.1 fatty acid--CoA ligase [Geomonas nitrogeniifigens]QXE88423.1 fatty acid--CoA ligase [Geomonas nitrogeniifigens]
MSDLLIPRTPSAYDYPLLIKNMLLYPVIDNPEQEIVYRDLYRGSYRQLRERVARAASMLTGLGVRPGQTVAVMDWDSHRYLELFFAVPMIGAVLHTINVRLSPEQILYTIDHAEDDVLLVNAEFLPILEQIRGRIDNVRTYVLISDDKHNHDGTVPFAGEYEELLAKASPVFDFPELDENTRATTFYTTGTTGMPKGVYFSHRQLVLHTMGLIATLGSATAHGCLHRDDVYMPITPMFHVHAWGLPYVATMLGLKQVYPGRYLPETLLELKEREGATFSHCVPTILHMMLKHPHAERMDLRGWKLIIGGAALSRNLCVEALRMGLDVFTGYGMSETCPILTISQLTPAMLDLPPGDQAEIRCKTGLTLPLVDLRVVDADLKELPRDGVSAGNVVVRSPWLTQGYLKDHKASERLWEGGYLHTGDVAVRDELGYLRITDRSKDVIKVAGEWVSSLELEDIITHHPAVAEVAVIGKADEKWGERPMALVVPKPSVKITEKDISHHVRQYADKGVVSKQVVLVKVKFVDAIDKTSVGKINKVALREKHLS